MLKTLSLHVAGYCVVNDVSERFYQTKLAGQWTKGKSCDTFGPIGPWLVTADEIADPQNLVMTMDVNGERMQIGNTNDMIFTVREIIAHLSSLMTLHPGDIIATGTPPGVEAAKSQSPFSCAQVTGWLAVLRGSADRNRRWSVNLSDLITLKSSCAIERGVLWHNGSTS